MKFTPKPGDKIICNNGEEFICCTLEFLHDHGIKPMIARAIIGFYPDEETWQDWDENGKASDYYNDEEYNIREVIPAESEEGEEPRYTVEEVTEAFANALHLSWMGGRQEGINKVKDYLSKKHNAEYQEYLRLKSIYE